MGYTTRRGREPAQRREVGKFVGQRVERHVGKPAQCSCHSSPRIYKEETMKPYKNVRCGNFWFGLRSILYDGLRSILCDGLRGDLRTFLAQPTQEFTKKKP